MGYRDGDLLLIIADSNKSVVYDALGALRCELAARLGMVDDSVYKFVWITDFPLFEYDEQARRYTAKHHPFTAPADEDVALLESAPEKVRAKAYDIVLNGTELGGGSLRIYDRELQSRMFKALGFTEERAEEQFGFLLSAFRLRRAAPRRARLRVRPPAHAHDEVPEHPRRYRFPQGAECVRPHGRMPRAGRTGAVG